MNDYHKISADDTDDLDIANYIDDVEDYHEEKKVHTTPLKKGTKAHQ